MRPIITSALHGPGHALVAPTVRFGATSELPLVGMSPNWCRRFEQGSAIAATFFNPIEVQSMKRFVAVVLYFLSLTAAEAASVQLSSADQVAVRVAALDYAQGWYQGDRVRMERSLHDKLAKRAYLTDKVGTRSLHEMEKRKLLAGNTPGHAVRYADAAKRAEIEILDGLGNVATVKLTMDGWVDYMHLARTEQGEWRILNVLWELTPK